MDKEWYETTDKYLIGLKIYHTRLVDVVIDYYTPTSWSYQMVSIGMELIKMYVRKKLQILDHVSLHYTYV